MLIYLFDRFEDVAVVGFARLTLAAAADMLIVKSFSVGVMIDGWLRR